MLKFQHNHEVRVYCNLVQILFLWLFPNLQETVSLNQFQRDKKNCNHGESGEDSGLEANGIQKFLRGFLSYGFENLVMYFTRFLNNENNLINAVIIYITGYFE